MRQLQASDASFLYQETPTAPMHTGALSIYDPSTSARQFLGFKDILAHFESRLHRSSGFRQKVIRLPFDFDHPFWVDDPDFDLEYHVRHIALPKPGDWRQLCIQVGRLLSRPLDLNRPLWEYTIIEGLDNIDGLPKGSFAILNKVHHSLVDGKSGLEMLTALHDLDAGPSTQEVARPWAPAPTPKPAELIAEALTTSLGRQFNTALNLHQAFAGAIGKAVEGAVKPEPVSKAPKTLFNGKLSSHRVFDGATFDLDDVKAVRVLAAGATVNDVALTIVGGALRCYLEAHGESPTDTLRAVVPVSTRSGTDSSSTGNEVSVMTVGLGTHFSDPVERLSFVTSETRAAKAQLQAIGARTLTEIASLMPGALIGLGTRLSTQFGLAAPPAPIVNCAVTNIPGSQKPLYFAGAKQVLFMGYGPVVPGLALTNVIVSYCGKMMISFTSDRTIMPDPDKYTACLKESFEECLSACKTA